ncbi:Stress responsive A/B Barrel Domain [Cribrihabitans marinus]|uniref:Stress responsive A/B Barrel Domain n=1 Tax=Cribrihabitans marinus TaxID=1227549 RepID=A0A1H7DSW6_9RHOB|nr:Dabb family protein [Cribrihabitans marinus]GGH40015.1 hypothetical protein GCM10010973_36200 [Cribrihabitans marinus]SEK04638.1 Stress responsive A/B Barrel Domain [Cribrihabitans marinus]
MIRHIVMFNWKPGTDPAVVDQVSAGFAKMCEAIPHVQSMSWGPDQGLAEANFDYAMTADFASVEDWNSYQAHAEHVAFFQKFGAHAAEAARVQIEI